MRADPAHGAPPAATGGALHPPKVAPPPRERHRRSTALGVFFAIWWAWMNFTWFASAYDTDDVAYRLTTLVQISGALILAAGVPDAMDGSDFAVITAGYVVMRLAMVSQWLRAARADPPHRRSSLRFAAGIG